MWNYWEIVCSFWVPHLSISNYSVSLTNRIKPTLLVIETMKKCLLLLTIIVLGFTSISAKKYIADVYGTSAGTGTLVSPYDLPTAITKEYAGDTLYIRGSQCMLTSLVSLSKAETAAAFISIMAYSADERPVLDFYNRAYSGTNTSSERGIRVPKDYHYVYGLDITHAGDNSMHIQSSNNRIQNGRFYKNYDGRLQISKGTGGYN